MRPSLSCDVISVNSGDMFAQMRLGLQFQRCMDNDRVNERGEMPQQVEPRSPGRACVGDRQRRGGDGARGRDRLADAGQAGGRDRRRRPAAQHGGADRRGGRGCAPGERRPTCATCWSAAASPSATASWSASTSSASAASARESQERVLGRVEADGVAAAAAERQPGFDEALAQMALANLGRAPSHRRLLVDDGEADPGPDAALRRRDVGDRSGWRPTRPARSRCWDAARAPSASNGHHYALVVIEGLEPGSIQPYEVALDGERRWPEEGSRSRPASSARSTPKGRSRSSSARAASRCPTGRLRR